MAHQISMPRQQPTGPLPPRERLAYEIKYSGTRKRMGYNVGAANARRQQSVGYEPWWRRVKTEEHLGIMMFSAGIIWATNVQTIEISNIVRLLLTPGPVQTAGTGVLIWLHAKWRRSVRLV